MKSHSTAMKTCRLTGAIPSGRFVLKVLANEIRVVREKTPIGTCSRIGNGKRSRIATRREAKDRDRHPVAATGIVVVEVETVADAAGIVVDAVDGTNGLARRDRHVPKSVRAATNLVLPTRHPRLSEVNPVIRLLGHDVTTAHAMIVAREPNANLIVPRAVTSLDQR